MVFSIYGCTKKNLCTGNCIKKVFLLATFALAASFTFAKELSFELTDKIVESKLFCLDNSLAEDLLKPQVNFFYQTQEDFTNKTREVLSSEVFADTSAVTFEQIKDSLKECKNIFADDGSEFVALSWVDGKTLSYSVLYTQNKTGPIYGAGEYVIRVFENDSSNVYTIRISDTTNLESKDEDYEKLSQFFKFKKGKKSNPSKGIKGTQGYYPVTEDSTSLFYKHLVAKEEAIPQSAICFQTAEDFIEDFLRNHE